MLAAWLLQDNMLKAWKTAAWKGTKVSTWHMRTPRELTDEKKKIGFIVTEEMAHSCRLETCMAWQEKLHR